MRLNTEEVSVCTMASGANNIKMTTINEDIKNGLCRQRALSLIKEKHMHLFENFDEGIRPRTSSMPVNSGIKKPTLGQLHHRHHGRPSVSFNNDNETYTVRMFKVNSKGVIKSRTDSMRSRSTNSFSSDGGWELCAQFSQSSLASSSSQDSVGTYKSIEQGNTAAVLVLGYPGVGKTALTQQFMTSEYLGGFDTSMGMDTCFVQLITLPYLANLDLHHSSISMFPHACGYINIIQRPFDIHHYTIVNRHINCNKGH